MKAGAGRGRRGRKRRRAEVMRGVVGEGDGGGENMRATSGFYALVGANSGFVITAMMISAISAFLIDRRFRAAGVWCLLASLLTLLGFQHAFRIEPGQYSFTPQELMIWQRPEQWFAGTKFFTTFPAHTFPHRGYRIAIAYAAAGLLLLMVDRWRKSGKGFADLSGPAI